MKCHICNEDIENIQDDPKQPGKLLPCAACMEAINDVVYDDEPDEVEEDDFDCDYWNTTADEPPDEEEDVP